MLDRLLILAAIIFFFLVCLLIIKRRIIDKGLRAATLFGNVAGSVADVGKRGAVAIMGDILEDTKAAATASLASLAVATSASPTATSFDTQPSKTSRFLEETTLSAWADSDTALFASQVSVKTSMVSSVALSDASDSTKTAAPDTSMLSSSGRRSLVPDFVSVMENKAKKITGPVFEVTDYPDPQEFHEVEAEEGSCLEVPALPTETETHVYVDNEYHVVDEL